MDTEKVRLGPSFCSLSPLGPPEAACAFPMLSKMPSKVVRGEGLIPRQRRYVGKPFVNTESLKSKKGGRKPEVLGSSQAPRRPRPSERPKQGGLAVSQVVCPLVKQYSWSIQVVPVEGACVAAFVLVGCAFICY